MRFLPAGALRNQWNNVTALAPASGACIIITSFRSYQSLDAPHRLRGAIKAAGRLSGPPLAPDNDLIWVDSRQLSLVAFLPQDRPATALPLYKFARRARNPHTAAASTLLARQRLRSDR